MVDRSGVAPGRGGAHGGAPRCGVGRARTSRRVRRRGPQPPVALVEGGERELGAAGPEREPARRRGKRGVVGPEPDRRLRGVALRQRPPALVVGRGRLLRSREPRWEPRSRNGERGLACRTAARSVRRVRQPADCSLALGPARLDRPRLRRRERTRGRRERRSAKAAPSRGVRRRCGEHASALARWRTRERNHATVDELADEPRQEPGDGEPAAGQSRGARGDRSGSWTARPRRSRGREQLVQLRRGRDSRLRRRDRQAQPCTHGRARLEPEPARCRAEARARRSRDQALRAQRVPRRQAARVADDGGFERPVAGGRRVDERSRHGHRSRPHTRHGPGHPSRRPRWCPALDRAQRRDHHEGGGEAGPRARRREHPLRR